MKRAAVILAPGFEEGESLTIADILRRAEITCDLVGFSEIVEGTHGIVVKCDRVLAEGYEEGETTTIVDILRRAGLNCQTFGFVNEFVKGMHGMFLKADRTFGLDLYDYDMVILPGGRPGGANLRENPDVIRLVQDFNAKGKYIEALCSGTLVLEEAQVITGKKVTGYTGYEEKMKSGIFLHEVAVADQNIITSQGPATPYPFAFKVAECFGKEKEVSEMKDRLMYSYAGGR